MTEMTAPKIELKSIKHNERLSDETHCYSATLYVDGEKWGEVSNHGHGGCDDFHGVAGRTWDDIKALNERIKATMPKIEAYGMELETDLEIICGDLVDEWLTMRDIKRETNKAAVFFAEGLPTEGQTEVLRTISLKGRTLEVAITYIRGKYPKALIINELPEAERLAAWRRAQ